MKKFIIGTNSYKKMPMFTRMLSNRGIQFKNNVNGRLIISVVEEHVREFIELAENNNIELTEYSL